VVRGRLVNSKSLGGRLVICRYLKDFTYDRTPISLLAVQTFVPKLIPATSCEGSPAIS
jgi:hypothetical protein